MRRGPDTGADLHAPIRSRVESATLHPRSFDDLSFNAAPYPMLDQYWDFCGKFATGFGEGLAAQTTTTAGAPTVAQVVNSPFGEVAATLAATSEIEFAGISFGDQLQYPATNQPLFAVYGKWPANVLSVNEDIVLGWSTAYNSTLNLIAKYIRFRLSGSNEIFVEGNDGTNVFSVDTGIAAVAGAKFFLTIEHKRRDKRYYFFHFENLVGALSLPAFLITDLFQPLVGIRKSTGVTAQTLTVDFLRLMVKRF
jgi:hypothetical protein